MGSDVESAGVGLGPEVRVREALSDLMDGQSRSADWAVLSQAWRGSAEVREHWHAYHLLGDVMRSEELAHAAQRDEALLQAVRRRLAQEPVVLAPAGLSSAGARAVSKRRVRRRWVSAGAMAAGVATVGVALFLTRLGLPGAPDDTGGSRMATAVPGVVPVTASVPAVVAGGSPGEAPSLAVVQGPQGLQVVPAASSVPVTAGSDPSSAGAPTDPALGTGRILRDEQLDRYLAAHRQFGAAAVPGHVLRSAATQAPAER